MRIDKIVKNSRIIIIFGIIVGVLLLGTGIVFSIIDSKLISNNKAIIGLSFLPLALAFIYYLKLSIIKTTPEKINNIIISESDERLVALKNEADSKAFFITKGAIFFAFLAYTFLVPEDIFESIGWWILMGLLFISFISQGIFAVKSMRDTNSKEQ